MRKLWVHVRRIYPCWGFLTSPQAASTHVHEYVEVPDQLSDRNISTSETMSVIPLTLGTRRKMFEEVGTRSNTSSRHACKYGLCFVEFDRLCFQLKHKCQPATETILMLAEIVIKRSIGESLLTSMFKFFGITIYDLVHSCSHAFSRAQCALDAGCMNLFESD